MSNGEEVIASSHTTGTSVGTKSSSVGTEDIKNLIKEEIKSLYWLKILIVSDVSPTTVVFLSKDKNANVKRRPVKSYVEEISIV